MEKCFVIQPFDNDKFDQRYEDVFQPAIKKTELQPYRIDKDLSVRVPIDDIEKNIAESRLCFAEITTDNPNVWYELGYAFACDKDVIMFCSDERTSKYPFDIQHRHITKYGTNSRSDFDDLEKKLTEKINAYLSISKTVTTLNKSPIAEREGLKSHEIAMLILIMENQMTSEENVSIYKLKDEMNKAGYKDIVTSVGIRALRNKKYIETFAQEHLPGEEYPACRVTEDGENWILNNQDELEFRINQKNSSELEDDGLPF